MPKWQMWFWLSVSSLPFFIFCITLGSISLYFLIKKGKPGKVFTTLVIVGGSIYFLYLGAYCIIDTAWWYQFEKYKDDGIDYKKGFVMDWRTRSIFIQHEISRALQNSLILKSVPFEGQLEIFTKEGKLLLEGCSKLADKLGIKKANNNVKNNEELWKYFINHPQLSSNVKTILKHKDFRRFERLKELEIYFKLSDYKLNHRTESEREKIYQTSQELEVSYIFEDYYSMDLQTFSSAKNVVFQLYKTSIGFNWFFRSSIDLAIWSCIIFIILVLFIPSRKYLINLDREIEDLKITNIKSKGWSDDWRREEAEKDRQYILNHSTEILRHWLRNQHKYFGFRSSISVFLGEDDTDQIKEFFKKDNEELYKRLQIVEGEGR